MSISRVKNIAIAVLILINAFFLAIIIIDTYADARDERQTLENVCEVLRANGIAISPDSITPAGTLRTMRTARGEEFEASIANALLGEVDLTDRGLIYLYENEEKGSAEFSSAGNFEISLNVGVITNTEGSLRKAQELLKEMKLETTGATVYAESKTEIVTVYGAYRDARIFNCVIYFTFEEGSLRTVTGRFVTGIEPTQNSAELSYVSTALLEFLAAVKRGDAECDEIQSVEAGYIHSVAGPFGEGQIEPVWLITTPTAQYTINSTTGETRVVN